MVLLRPSPMKGPRLEILWYHLVKQPTDFPTTQTTSASAAASPLSCGTNSCSCADCHADISSPLFTLTPPNPFPPLSEPDVHHPFPKQTLLKDQNPLPVAISSVGMPEPNKRS